MSKYTYAALGKNGETVRGEGEYRDDGALFSAMQTEGLTLVSYSRGTGAAKFDNPFSKKMLPNKELSVFCRKLSVTFASGMSIVSGLDTIVSSTSKPAYKQLYVSLYELVRSGRTLSSALADYSDYFPALLINMIAAGEESGNFESITEKLALYFERQQKIRSKIKTATIYPKILAVLCVGVVIVLFAFVLPKLFGIFGEDMLPPISRFMLNLSRFMVERWYMVVIGIVLAFIGLKALFKLPSVQLWRDKVYIGLPVIGKLLKKIYSDRFASTLTMLYSSGLSMLSGIRLSTNVIGNSYMESRMEEVSEAVSGGSALSSSLAATGMFDPMLPNMVGIGEESGSLDSMLNSISSYYEEETSTAIEQLLAILEPALLIIMAVIIGTILISVMIPIFNTYALAAA